MIPIRRRLYQSLAGFTPRQLFAALQGAWLEPTPGYIWQENTGITPTTTTGGQTLGLMLDQSQGAVLGPELVTNGTFDTDTSGWTAVGGSISSVNGLLRVTSNGALSRATQSFTTSIGKLYTISVTAYKGTSANYLAYVGSVPAGNDYLNKSAPDGSVTVSFIATSITCYINLYCGTSGAGNYSEYDNISVRQILGNHAAQSTAANRPTYQLDSNGLPLARHDTTDSLVVSLPAINVRRNLLTYSEQFDNGAWSTLNSTVNADVILAPNGSQTADKITENTALGVHRVTWYAGYTGSAGQVLTYSVYIKSAGRNHALISSNFSDRSEDRVVINLTTGAVSVPVGSVVSYASAQANDGWWRVTVTQTKASSVQKTFWVGSAIGTGTTDNSYTGDGTSGIYVWGAQLELGSVATDYQKITDWTSEAYSSSGSVYFATPQGMSALHNQSMGLTYTLPALSTDIYSWIVVPQRLSTVLEGRLERYMLRKANLPEPDYLLDSSDNQLTADDGTELLLRA